jgi:hypothetical protein
MAFTYQTVVDLARYPLNDQDKTRLSDDELLAFANAGMLQLVLRRPDLFVGQFNNLPSGQNALTDTFPLTGPYVQTVADYVTFRSETVDDEKMNEPRAIAFAQLFGTVAPA